MATFLIIFLLFAFPCYAQTTFNGGSGSGLSISIPNDAVTGTTLHTLTKVVNGKAIIVSTTDTTGIKGVCVAGCGKSGNAVIREVGQVPVLSDGALTADHFLQNSTTTQGAVHDTGSSTTYPSTLGIVLGQSSTTAGSAGTYLVNLFSPDVVSPSGAGAGLPGGGQGSDQYNLNGTTTFGGSLVLKPCAFAGASGDVKILAAQSALLAANAGGGTIDMTCFGATNVQINAQVTFGSCTTKPTINVIVDPATVFTCNIAGGGAGTCWLLNSGVSIWASRNTGAYTHVTNQGFTASSTANVATIMQVGNSASCTGGTLFTAVQGLSFFQETTSPTVTKAILWYDSPSNAGSIENNTIFGWNQPGAVGILVDNNNGFGPVILLNNEVDSGYQSCTPLKIAQATTTGFAGITVIHGEYQHPGTGAGCGQSIWAQSFSSCSVALSPITLIGPHVESGNLTDSDILIDGARSVTSLGTWGTAGNNGAATNLFKIQNRAGGCSANHIKLIGSTNWNSGVSGNVITNIPSGYNSGAVDAVDDYEYASSGLGTVIDSRSSQLLAVPLATLGTCNAAAEGSRGRQNNSTAACVANAVATSAGTTHCFVDCDGTNWRQEAF